MRRAASADRGVRTRPARATRRPAADGRTEGHQTLPDRASPTLWRGRCTPPQTARRFDHSPGRGPSPWVWAPLPSPLDGSCGLARAPLGSDPRESQGSAAMSGCAHPAGGRAARGPCSPILSPDPLLASSVPTPAKAPRRFVLGAAVPAHGLHPSPHEHRSVAHDRQVQHPAAGDRPRSQRAVGELDAPRVDVERQDHRQVAVRAGLQARLHEAAVLAGAPRVVDVDPRPGRRGRADRASARARRRAGRRCSRT
jgi:hypothetical protein